jgi:hypothetical protein
VAEPQLSTTATSPSVAAPAIVEAVKVAESRPALTAPQPSPQPASPPATPVTVARQNPTPAEKPVLAANVAPSTPVAAPAAPAVPAVAPQPEPKQVLPEKQPAILTMSQEAKRAEPPKSPASLEGAPARPLPRALPIAQSATASAPANHAQTLLTIACVLLVVATGLIVFLLHKMRGGAQPSLISQSISKGEDSTKTR